MKPSDLKIGMMIKVEENIGIIKKMPFYFIYNPNAIQLSIEWIKGGHEDCKIWFTDSNGNFKEHVEVLA